MLTKNQIEEIREHLEKAQNPVFFFDNDIDGLMSFILLRRKINRGRGVAIKSFPELDVNYFRRVEEFNADYIFILDKPLVSKEFIEKVKEKNIPIVWIDHHDVDPISTNENVFYYNPFLNKDKSNEPTSFLSYKIVDNKDEKWLAMVGCIGDNFLPDFTEEFSKEYSDIWKKEAKSAFEILYESEFGKLVIMLDFALKDRTSSVVSMMNFLFKVKFPSDILIENEKNMNILKRYEELNKIYQKLIERAKNVARNPGKLIVFKYSGGLSMSADLSNELSYRFPGKVIIVVYIKDIVVNLSIRGKIDIRKITLKAIKSLENATGGGHKNATGAKIQLDDLPKFIEVFEKEIN